MLERAHWNEHKTRGRECTNECKTSPRKGEMIKYSRGRVRERTRETRALVAVTNLLLFTWRPTNNIIRFLSFVSHSFFFIYMHAGWMLTDWTRIFCARAHTHTHQLRGYDLSNKFSSDSWRFYRLVRPWGGRLFVAVIQPDNGIHGRCTDGCCSYTFKVKEKSRDVERNGALISNQLHRSLM